jgi:hypothetical protein
LKGKREIFKAKIYGIILRNKSSINRKYNINKNDYEISFYECFAILKVWFNWDVLRECPQTYLNKLN